MSPLVTITLVTLLLTASTVLITFCVYSQGRSNHTWMFQNLEGLGLLSPTLLGLGKSNAQNGIGLEDPIAAAGQYELALKSQGAPDAETLIQLSRIYTDNLLQPNATVALLQPYLQVQQATSLTEEEPSTKSGTDVSCNFRSNLDINCAYLQALVQIPSHSQQMLQYFEALRAKNVSFDACIYYAQHQVLISRMYYADAYQTSVEFVRAYPTLHQSHTAMGEALLSLQRNNEAAAVLRVAHSLVDAQAVQAALSAPNTHRNASLDSLVRLGDALHACDALVEAESVYTLVTGLLQPAELAQQCALLSRVAQLQHKLGHYAQAYVASLQCVKYCPKHWEGYLQLGNAQHGLGLLHDAATSLKVAARSKALKKEARALLKAVKATEDAQLRKQARQDEEKLGPQPPLDPNIKRQEPKGLYIDFLAQLEKEKAEKEKQAKESVTAGAPKPADVKVGVKAGPSATIVAPVPVPPTKVTTNEFVKEPAPTASAPATEVTEGQPPVQDKVSLSADGPSVEEQDTDPRSSSEQSARTLADQYIAYANAFVAQNNPVEAMKKLKVAIKKAPRYADAYLARGDLHVALGDIASATADYLKVYTELDLHNATCAEKVHNIVLQMVHTGRTAEGIALLAQLGHRPVLRDERVAMELATALAHNKEYKEALLVLYSVDPLVPLTAQRVKLTARMLEHMDLIVRASETLYTGIYQNLTTYEDLGEMYMRNNNYTMAIKAFESALPSTSSSTSSASSPLPHDASKETARMHDHLARAYLALHEEAQAVVAEDIAFDIVNGDSQSDSAAVANREHLEKAKFHYQQADKYGVFNAEMRKFYARYPEFSHTSGEPGVSEQGVEDKESTPSQVQEGLHTEAAARSHARPRWLSRRSAAPVEVGEGVTPTTESVHASSENAAGNHDGTVLTEQQPTDEL